MLKIGLAALIVVCLSSCKEDKEANALAKAQKCLDKVPESQPAQALACLDGISQYSSKQSNILKCSIYMTAGGLVESKIVDAYEALKGTTQNKEAVFMMYLSLEDAGATQGLDVAKNADEFCQATGISGLQYLSGLIVAGTSMRQISENVGLPITSADLANGNVSTIVDNLMTTCSPTAGVNPCLSDPQVLEALSDAVVNLGESYCAVQGTNQAACDQVRDALDASSGSGEVSEALMCYLAGRQYSSATGQCIN